MLQRPTKPDEELRNAMLACRTRVAVKVAADDRARVLGKTTSRWIEELVLRELERAE